jgi:hypothetical protein
MLVMSAANKVGEVTIERFAEILEWFGPFTANGKTFLSNIKKITRLPYAFFFVLLLRLLLFSPNAVSRDLLIILIILIIPIIVVIVPKGLLRR